MSGARPALAPGARAALGRILDLLASEGHAVTSVRDPARAWEVHVADSLVGLEVAELAGAARIADLGAGAGFPGLALAAALPAAHVALIESVGRKAEFIRAAIAAGGLENAVAVHVRSEEWAREPPPAGGREAYDAVAARAVGRLATLAELASPLLRDGGVLVAWKGRRDPEEEAEVEAAGARIAMAPDRVLAVKPYPASRNRHIHVIRKSAPTPPNLPRRPGRAAKR